MLGLWSSTKIANTRRLLHDIANRTPRIGGKEIRMVIPEYDRQDSPEERKIQDEFRQRQNERHREHLARVTTCVKGTDPDTFKPSWSVWVDGAEVIRLDPESVLNLVSKYGKDALPPEISAFLTWMDQLSEKREQEPAETFADKAKIVPH